MWPASRSTLKSNGSGEGTLKRTKVRKYPWRPKFFFECGLVVKDVYNMIAKFKRDLLEREDKLTALMQRIEADASMHRIKVDSQNRLFPSLFLQAQPRR